MGVPDMASLFKISIEKLKGVGPKSAECLNRLGISTIGDLIKFYPRSYEDWTTIYTLSEAVNKGERCIKLKILSDLKTLRLRSGKFIYKLEATDGYNFADIVFFNNKYTPQSLVKNKEYLFRGSVKGTSFKFEIVSPKTKKVDEFLSLFPVYNQTKGLTSSKISGLVKNALELLPQKISETLPDKILNEVNLCSLDFAVRNIHFPKNRFDLKSARKRLVFEEFFIYQLNMRLLKKRARQSTGVKITENFSSQFEKMLPFELTNAQKKSISECLADLQSGFSMNRLLQGDVGSGKTAVAASVAYNVAKNGYQVAIMAPTEILALQHYKTFLNFYKNSKINIGVLYGSMRLKEKNKVLGDIQNGNVDIIIGTHSLISENVIFKNLGFIVTDEQHRFGVKQRENLIKKGINPHVLVMSATPIPRTLAMILYGDLDISVINETLPGRQKTDTFKVDSQKRHRAWNFLRKIVDNGGQGYIVCACIEENENEIADVKTYKEKMLESAFNESEVNILHGKMSSAEKDEVMKNFIEGKTKILISTTVIEVGVDVPNAQIMIIENAERFGISQLHQLRGRVGRSDKKSYCILISDSKSKDSFFRFNALTASNDGFYLSEEDLKLRGPGDFFGVNQHGVPNIGIATSYEDVELMKSAQKEVEKIINIDSIMSDAEYKFIKQRLKSNLEPETTDGSFEIKNIVF